MVITGKRSFIELHVTSYDTNNKKGIACCWGVWS
jgi:hypothetical protein